MFFVGGRRYFLFFEWVDMWMSYQGDLLSSVRERDCPLVLSWCSVVTKKLSQWTPGSLISVDVHVSRNWQRERVKMKAGDFKSEWLLVTPALCVTCSLCMCTHVSECLHVCLYYCVCVKPSFGLTLLGAVVSCASYAPLNLSLDLNDF